MKYRNLTCVLHEKYKHVIPKSCTSGIYMLRALACYTRSGVCSTRSSLAFTQCLFSQIQLIWSLIWSDLISHSLHVISNVEPNLAWCLLSLQYFLKSLLISSFFRIVFSKLILVSRTYNNSYINLRV